MEVSVIVPARDEASVIGACLDALAAQSLGAPALEVIVVAAGEDDTAGAAALAAARARFGRFDVVRLAHGNKNAALQVGCARAAAPIVVLLDADTVLGTDTVEELASALRDGPERALHGAALPRFDTWVSRYWELNRMLVKELRFDGQLSGELIALRRATLAAHDLAALFPEAIGAKDDLYLGRALAAMIAEPATPKCRQTRRQHGNMTHQRRETNGGENQRPMRRDQRRRRAADEYCRHRRLQRRRA